MDHTMIFCGLTYLSMKTKLRHVLIRVREGDTMEWYGEQLGPAQRVLCELVDGDGAPDACYHARRSWSRARKGANMSSFFQRVQQLPTLGIGVSTEYGAAQTPEALDVLALRQTQPQFAGFLEVGVEVVKGLDDTAQRWVQEGLTTTYHFLDLNLDEPEDFETPWLEAAKAIADQIKPAWLCGDAGLWHFGPRERGHMLLLPPILCTESALQQAEGIIRLREQLGYEVWPENPPGHVYLGDLHILEYYAEVAERADTGFLLDCAHLAIYQAMMGYDPCAGLDGFALDRVVELHVAGSTRREHDGLAYWDDDHTPHILDDTWRIFERVVPHAPNLKAVVFECERNPLHAVLAGFERIASQVAPLVEESRS
jgi:uncharacterized protein (UPF0276 family)